MCYAMVWCEPLDEMALRSARDRLSHGLTIDLHREVNMRSASWMLLVLTLLGTAAHSDIVGSERITRLQSS